MKLPKNRRLYPELIRQYKQQEKRLRNCGYEAWFSWHSILIFNKGTYFSERFNSYRQSI